MTLCRRLLAKHKTLLKHKKRDHSFDNFMSTEVTLPKALEVPHKRNMEKSENIIHLQQKNS